MSPKPAAYPELAPAENLLPGEQQGPGARSSFMGSWRRRGSRWLVHRGLRLLLAVYAALMRVAKLVGPAKRSVDGKGYDILLTGTFHSDNWVRSHVLPLAMAKHCARVRVVSIYPMPTINKVEAIYPRAWLVRLVGPVPARLITFAWVGLRTRPHIVGGFHLLLNGLVAALLGRLTGSHSLYFCVGGPAEVLDGGIHTESRIFEKLGTPTHAIERQLLQAVGTFDLVITMGSGATNYFRQQGVDTTYRVVAGGLDAERFHPPNIPPTTDLILVGRLVPIKRIDLFLQSVKCAKRVFPNITATVVGDGPLRADLERLAAGLGLEPNVIFVGHQGNVEDWLRKARVFVLTSDSEGLALSLMEAMLCGLPAVVSKVGDLADLVQAGVNGYLVEERTPKTFAARIVDLLADGRRLALFGKAARRSAMRYEVGAITEAWERILPYFDVMEARTDISRAVAQEQTNTSGPSAERALRDEAHGAAAATRPRAQSSGVHDGRQRST